MKKPDWAKDIEGKRGQNKNRLLIVFLVSIIVGFLVTIFSPTRIIYTPSPGIETSIFLTGVVLTAISFIIIWGLTPKYKFTASEKIAYALFIFAFEIQNFIEKKNKKNLVKASRKLQRLVNEQLDDEYDETLSHDKITIKKGLDSIKLIIQKINSIKNPEGVLFSSLANNLSDVAENLYRYGYIESNMAMSLENQQTNIKASPSPLNPLFIEMLYGFFSIKPLYKYPVIFAISLVIFFLIFNSVATSLTLALALIGVIIQYDKRPS